MSLANKYPSKKNLKEMRNKNERINTRQESSPRLHLLFRGTVATVVCFDCNEYKGVMTMKEWEEYTNETWEA